MKNCSIAEDLLPLYNEDLLREDSKDWLEKHLATCESCAKLRQLSEQPIETVEIESPIDYEKMMKKNTLKISIYQLIFVGISFFVAMRSVVLMEDFSFVLYGTILGFITYLFYKRYAIVMLISFVPVFLLHFGIFLIEINEILTNSHTTLFVIIRDSLYGAFIMGAIHLLFSLIGATIGFFTLKLLESEDTK